MNTPRQKIKGFTIVELLIVIVVVGILAAISIVAYNGIQQRSRASAIANGISSIEKAFRLHAITEARDTWWLETEIGTSGNPRINNIISNTNMKNYIQTEPIVGGMTSSYWFYDNDGDTRNLATCGTSMVQGANLSFENINSTTAQAVDNMIDDGDLSCGKLRMYGTNQLQYSLSADQSF